MALPTKRRGQDDTRSATPMTKSKSEYFYAENFSPEFWDSSSDVFLTRRALRELNRRNAIKQLPEIGERTHIIELAHTSWFFDARSFVRARAGNQHDMLSRAQETYEVCKARWAGPRRHSGCKCATISSAYFN